MICSFCGETAEGNYSIHRDGFGIGPEVPLCDEHGGHRTPTCAEIWDRISHHDTSNVVSLGVARAFRFLRSKPEGCDGR